MCFDIYLKMHSVRFHFLNWEFCRIAVQPAIFKSNYFIWIVEVSLFCYFFIDIYLHIHILFYINSLYHSLDTLMVLNISQSDQIYYTVVQYSNQHIILLEKSLK